MRLCSCPPSDAVLEEAGRNRRDWTGTPKPQPTGWLISVLVSILAAAALALFLQYAPDASTLFREDGPIETLQAAVLVVVAGLFAVGFRRSAGSRAFFCLLAAYACIFAVTREIPRCGSAFVGGEVCLPSSWKRAVVLGASALAVLALVLRPLDWRAVLRPSNIFWVWPSAIVLGFLVSAEALESLVYYSAIEEFLELVAYFHLGFIAVSILRQPVLR
ncbi:MULTISPECIES: hypothetical protein [unclassified Aureimonas]|uniref:hypothetical protein n=1 Tax=unclassified Aureimonas TaxID=2615206 RepID=UPI0006FC51AE|nr:MULTISPECIES: hypothetical protein [unclassified Aureimonas]KQT52896.1 hypothetical protein ASG62_13365 [Aureimonas sp. Leaf427]KQT80355.1 hypothetical protein ASG54_07215 [Aureimonas sp. Leaf460]